MAHGFRLALEQLFARKKEAIAHALNKVPARRPSPNQLELLAADVAECTK